MRRLAVVQKKERRGFTPFGWSLLLLSFCGVGMFYVFGISGFLSPNKPAGTGILVVEGYLPDYALEEAIVLFHAGDYDHLLVTGKKRAAGAHLDQYKNDGEFSAATLRALGFDSTLLSVVATGPSLVRDRTYGTALATHTWIRQHFPEAQSVDLVSLGCHSRRSWRLFRLVFDEDKPVGIYSIRDRSYDPESWWKSSNGFREVSKESIAWIYARFLFHPGKD